MPKLGHIAIFLLLLAGISELTRAEEKKGPVAFKLGPDGQPMAIEAKPKKENGDGSSENEANKENKGDESAEGKEKKGDEEPPEPKVIRRGDAIDGDGDPDELKATVGEDGRVSFQFRNQSWLALAQWLSDITDKPLDWLELPGDRVNLASPGRYTVAETQDLFNRHLLSRGYTILDQDGGLTIVKTESINPAMVPRVSIEQLGQLPPHTFVRTSLDVGWLSADQLTKELAAMISTNGRLTSMSTTNRIEGMDSVVNLREIAKVLENERSTMSREALAPEFPLRYLPATEAKQLLEDFLGVKKEKSGPLTPQQMQMLRQQLQQRGGSSSGGSDQRQISIVANVRRNSILIRAPLDRIAVATEFLKRIDVPNDAMKSLADIQSLVQVFRLASLDPQKLIEIISEMNVLEPTTRIRADKDNKALIVSGSAADRYIIKNLIERLDGSGRSFQVLQLRRLDANEVAESIAFLMGQEKEEDNSSSRRRYSYYYGYDDEEESSETDEFRVAANTRYRQVLLWASESEMEQVESLLIKLGELPPPGGSKRTVRMIDASATPETYEYLQKLQRQWKAVAPNPLELPDRELFKDPIKDGKSDEAADGTTDDKSDNTDKSPAADQNKPVPKPNADGNDLVLAPENSQPRTFLTVMQNPQADQTKADTKTDPNADAGPIRSSKDFDRMFRPETNQPKKPDDETKANAPVKIALDPQGNLILSSEDTKALDQLENLMLQAKPPRRPYTVFKVTHASAFWVKLNLIDFFEENEEKESTSDSFYRWYWDMDDEEEEGPAGLGKGSKLRFVEDPDTNTIVVSGATNEQLQTIKELIDLWDVEEPANKRKMRFTQLVKIEFGQADRVAETIKEAYRDLLSSNDKSFGSQRGGNNGNGGGDEQRNKAQRKRDGNGSGLVDGESGRNGGGADFSFKGKLSIGVDMTGNSLLVSAEGEELLELVVGMIEKLDVASQSAGEVEIIQLSGDVSSEAIQRALKAFGAKSIQTVRGNQGNSTKRNRSDDE